MAAVAEFFPVGRIEGVEGALLRLVGSKKLRPLLLIAVGMILVTTAFIMKLGAPQKSAPDTVAYHYAQWLHERENMGFQGVVASRFSVKKVIWYLDGKPSIEDRLRKHEEHQNALIRLGYFKNRAFDWKGGDPNKFARAFRGQAGRIGFKEFHFFEFIQGQDTTVYVTAREKDMPAIKSIIETIESGSTNRW